MSYLFGDLTPFPHDANYIELIRDATEMCRAMLQAEANIERLRDEMDAEKQATSRAIEELRQIATDVADALRPHLGAHQGPVHEVTGRLAQTLRSVIEGAQNSLQSRRDSNLGQMEAKIAAERGEALPALEAFLVRHELPHTVWRIRWTGPPSESQVAEARAWATAPFGLDAAFELSLPANSPWLRTLRVADVKPEVALFLPKRARHGTVAKKFDLDRHFITEASATHDLTRLTLRKAPRPGTAGLELTWSGSDLSITPIDDESIAPGPLAPDPRDRLVTAGLRTAVEAHLRSFVTRRSRLLEAKLGPADVLKLDTPATLARVLLKSIAPLCREIIMRSTVRGELSLKRVVEDGRREEVFIKASELTKIFSTLPPRQAACFDELGLQLADASGAPVPAAPPRQSLPTGPVIPAGQGLPGAPAVAAGRITDEDDEVMELEEVTSQRDVLQPNVIIQLPLEDPDDEEPRH